MSSTYVIKLVINTPQRGYPDQIYHRHKSHHRLVVVGVVSGYLAYGTSVDYLHEEMGVPLTLTFEVFGSDNEGRRPSQVRMSNHLDGVRWARVLD